MNQFKNIKILFVLLFLIFILLYLFKNNNEMFINYPNQVDPTKPITNDSSNMDANSNYTSLLLYLKNNPAKSNILIKDIKTKFFNDSCEVKDNIEFDKIIELPYGLPF
jgi:hypothetical protein